MPTVEEVVKWKKELKDEINEFHQINEQYAFEFKIQNEIIRRYDEVLNTKASKMSVQLISDEVERLIDEKLLSTTTQFNAMNKQIASKLETVNEFTLSMPVMVTTEVAKALKEESQKPGGVHGPAFDIL